MAYTSDQLLLLESAISQGLLTVRVGDTLTTYQDLTQMRKLRDEMRAELGMASASKPAAVSYWQTGKGY